MKAAKDFVKLKVDLRPYNSPVAQELRKRFCIVGVPTIILLGPDSREIAGTRIVGYLPPQRFIERLKPLLATAPS